VRIKLTPKGLELHGRLDGIFQGHSAALEKSALANGDLTDAGAALRELEKFWDSRLGSGAFALNPAA
jgi:hypothetical protein